MLISEYLALRNQISVTTGNAVGAPVSSSQEVNEGESFAQALQQKIEQKRDEIENLSQTLGEKQSEVLPLSEKQGVSFSKHAMQRLSERDIDINSGDTLERLNKGVGIAADKGSVETLVLVDRNAFVVSVKNNKVITTIPQEEMIGNIFTNIDSTVIV